MSDKATGRKTGSPEGCDQDGLAAALLLGHVSIQICSLVAPCRRPILIATPLTPVTDLVHYMQPIGYWPQRRLNNENKIPVRIRTTGYAFSRASPRKSGLLSQPA